MNAQRQQQTESAAAEAELRAAEERIFAAIRDRDLAALEAELAEDFVHATAGGTEQGRGAFLQAIGDMPYRILSIRGEGLQVRLLGEVALLSGTQKARVALPEGEVVAAATAFVDVFARVGGRWRLRHAVSIELPEGDGSTS